MLIGYLNIHRYDWIGRPLGQVGRGFDLVDGAAGASLE